MSALGRRALLLLAAWVAFLTFASHTAVQGCCFPTLVYTDACPTLPPTQLPHACREALKELNGEIESVPLSKCPDQCNKRG